MPAQTQTSQKQLAAFCKRWKIAELAFIGRVMRGGADDRGGFDVLVRYTPDAAHTLFGVVRMEREIAELFGCEVDVVSREAIEQSRNPTRRKVVLNAAECLYAE